MEVRLALYLPRDAATVPLTRRILDAALASLGVTEDCRGDLQIAVAEACGNVIQHADPVREYHVTVTCDPNVCTIDVVDGGPGVDPERLTAQPAPTAESGRGLHLIQLLADKFDLRNREHGGAALHFVKRLAWVPGAPFFPPGP
jgi:serine/threonine-protein kinase RsbW